MTDPTPRAAWERVAGIYQQCLYALWPDRDYLPSAVPAFLAELLARVSASYYGNESKFVDDAWAVVLGVRKKTGIPETARAQVYRDELFSNLPNALYAGNRRRPSPVESAIETIRRLRDVRVLEEALAKRSLAALLGGSTSYGRFLNVRGGDAGSDLDLLIVVQAFEHLEYLIEGMRDMPAVSAADIETTLRRALSFRQLHTDNYKLCVFSAKVTLWEDKEDPLLQECEVTSAYRLSLHVLTRESFGRLLLADYPIIASHVVGREALISDYREEPPNRGDFQRSFSGRSKAIAIDHETHEESFVRATKVFLIDDTHSYYPGMFQNLVLPTFDVRWGDSDCRRLVDSFRWKMIDRLRYEQRVRPNELLRLSWAHTRSEVFAPHVARSVDNSTVLG